MVAQRRQNFCRVLCTRFRERIDADGEAFHNVDTIESFSRSLTTNRASPVTFVTIRGAAFACAVFVGAAVAYANHCPMDIAKIDGIVATRENLTLAQLTEVKRLRDQGEEFHRAGRHQESIDTLAKALKILGAK